MGYQWEYCCSSHRSSHGRQIMYSARTASEARCALASGLDYHERAHRQKRFELVDRAIVDRYTAGGPVHVAGIENRIVGTMDSDSVAWGNRPASEARDFASLHQLLVALAIDAVGVIEL